MSASLQGANVFDFSGYSAPAIIEDTKGMVEFFDSQVDGTTTLLDVINNMNSSLPPGADPIITIGDTPGLEDALKITFTQEMADSITAIYRPTEVSTFNAIGNFLFPVIYGVLAGGFAAKFFK